MSSTRTSQRSSAAPPYSCLGQFGVGKMNENGQRLLELCTYHDLCIANSYFPMKPQQKVSWRHPSSKHWHQLDLILFRRAALKNVLHTHTLVPQCGLQHRPLLGDCNQRGSTALRNSGTPVLRSTRCRAGEKAQLIPPEKHPPYPGNILAGQSNQR